jgi:hypothetical protein
MKRIFGIALLALPLAIGSVHAEGCWPFNVNMGGSFYFQSSRGLAAPQAGPWYLYWPLEAHFVAPAPTGYPYWPPAQALPPTTIGGPACPPGVPVAPAPVAPAAPVPAVPPPVTTAPSPQATPPPVTTMPAPATSVPQPATPATPRLQLPPYLQPTSYYPTLSSGQPPSYWYDR